MKTQFNQVSRELPAPQCCTTLEWLERAKGTLDQRTAIDEDTELADITDDIINARTMHIETVRELRRAIHNAISCLASGDRETVAELNAVLAKYPEPTL